MSDSRRFIVTGGAGFIGCNIVAALNQRGHDDILVVDNTDHPAKQQNLESIRFRICMDKHAFRQAFQAGQIETVDTVFHMGACSATTQMDTEFLEDNNTRYTRQLCEWSLENGARFIYASSAATYGDGQQGFSDDDQHLPAYRPLNPYGHSKHAFDQWALEEGLLNRIVGLKYFNVFGPHEDHKGDMRSMVNKAYGQIMKSGQLGLFKSYRPGYADGEQQRDFIYVNDAVNITLYFHDRPDISGLFNCGTGEARTWVDLARAVFKAMGKEVGIRMIDMPGNLREHYQYHTQADVSKLLAAGYEHPFTSLENAVSQYVHSHLASHDN